MNGAMIKSIRYISITLSLSAALGAAQAPTNYERSVRPDALVLGDAAFSPESNCAYVAGCGGGGGVPTTGCTITPISETGVVQTLMESGSYCLATDLTQGLIIDGISITVYMNAHVINVGAGANGILVNDDVVDFRVFGGAIDGQNLGTNNGINIGAAADVRIEGMTIVNCENGILLNTGATNTLISQTNCSANDTGLSCQGDIGTTVSSSAFNQNSFNGVFATDSQALLMEDCTANLTFGGIGIHLVTVQSCELVNCISSSNLSSGFMVRSVSNDVVLRGCYASDNDEGFIIISGSTDILVLNCTAEGNGTDGFIVAGASAVLIECVATFNGTSLTGNGFNFLNSMLLVRGCTATNNADYGFTTDTPANQFYSNVACQNNGGGAGLNYNSVVSAPVTSAYNMRGVQNVDCADQTPDAVDTILNEINDLGGCSVTVISVDEDVTLSLPGRYCLAVDFTNTITITGASITLDLNAHTMNVPAGGSSIIVDTTAVDVRIKNGFIMGDNAASVAGISVTTGADVRIEDIVSSNSAYGILLTNSQRATLNRVSCHTCFLAGIFCSADADTVIIQALCTGNMTGINCDGSQRFLIRECVINDSESRAISIIGNSQYGNVIDCVMNGFGPVAGPGGLVIISSNYIVVRGCSALGTRVVGSVGFYAATAVGICWLNNVAAQCDNGFFISASVCNVVARECSSINNVSNGFENDSLVQCYFYSNDACNNGVANFTAGVTSAPVFGGDCATYWQNVDCDFICPP